MSALSGIHTMSELFDRVRKDARRYTTKQPVKSDALYKRHMMHFLNRRCHGVHIDLPKLEREKVIYTSGSYPNQVLALCETSRRKVAPSSSVTLPTFCYNDGLSEEAAFDLAVKTSLDEVELCPLSSVPLRDPVSTIHGQVYERAAIEAWFEHSQNDPLTGERLLTTALF